MQCIHYISTDRLSSSFVLHIIFLKGTHFKSDDHVVSKLSNKDVMHVSIKQSEKYWSTHWGFVLYYNLPLFLELINQAPTYDRQKFNHFSFKLPKIILTKNWKATRRFTTGTNFILRRYYTQKRMLIFSLRAQCFGRIRTKTIYPQKPTCQFRRSLISYGIILNVKNTNCINTYISYALWS